MLNIYKDKKVLITGHTGFKGSWLSIWLKSLQAKVYGLSLDVPTIPSHFEAAHLSDQIQDYRFNICDSEPLNKIIKDIEPDFIFHLAAQPLVRLSYDDPLNTITTNALGTANILNSLRKIKKKVIAVMITSDKVYDNSEWVWGYREIDRLGGKDPYSASKGMAELVIKAFFNSYFTNSSTRIRIGIARAGNVIGGGDWASDRIIADCIKSWSKNKSVDIRNPDATRPWQHVLEPLSGYLTLGSSLYLNKNHNGQAYNFGPSANQNYSVGQLINQMSKEWKGASWNNMSNIDKKVPEANLLKLNCDKALSELKWSPVLSIHETLRFTMDWYKYFYDNPKKDIFDFSLKQINQYVDFAKKNKINWAI